MTHPFEGGTSSHSNGDEVKIIKFYELVNPRTGKDEVTCLACATQH